MLDGVGWPQRWQVAEGALSAVENERSRVGLDGTGHPAVFDHGGGEPTTLVVAWRHGTAIALGSGEPVTTVDTTTTVAYR